jgi:hypothetical protein
VKNVIEDIRDKVRKGECRLTLHALERCIERDISPDEIGEAILDGEIIEYYPNDKYGESCLLCGRTSSGKCLHVQCSLAPVWIVTAYDPSLHPEFWSEDFKKRK